MNEKFYTITNAEKITGIKSHVLRYWEKEFRWLAPRKNSAGRRIYSEHDIELIKLIDRLVHDEGYSLAGARKRIAALMALSDQLQLPISQVAQERFEWVKSQLNQLIDFLKRG